MRKSGNRYRGRARPNWIFTDASHHVPISLSKQRPLCDSREIASAGAESESDYSAFIHIYFVSPATFCLVVRDAVHGAECTRVPLLKSHRVEKAAARMKIGAGTFSASLETRALSCLKNLHKQLMQIHSSCAMHPWWEKCIFLVRQAWKSLEYNRCITSRHLQKVDISSWIIQYPQAHPDFGFLWAGNWYWSTSGELQNKYMWLNWHSINVNILKMKILEVTFCHDETCY